MYWPQRYISTTSSQDVHLVVLISFTAIVYILNYFELPQLKSQTTNKVRCTLCLEAIPAMY